jgi:hypothetical protein
MAKESDSLTVTGLSDLERHHILTLCEQQVREYPNFKDYRKINDGLIAKLKETK